MTRAGHTLSAFRPFPSMGGPVTPSPARPPSTEKSKEPGCKNCSLTNHTQPPCGYSDNRHRQLSEPNSPSGRHVCPSRPFVLTLRSHASDTETRTKTRVELSLSLFLNSTPNASNRRASIAYFPAQKKKKCAFPNFAWLTDKIWHFFDASGNPFK